MNNRKKVEAKAIYLKKKKNNCRLDDVLKNFIKS